MIPHRFRVRHRRVVDAFADQGIIEIANFHPPTLERNNLVLQSMRIAAAVPPFLAGLGDTSGGSVSP
jgi:hypothetical protein